MIKGKKFVKQINQLLFAYVDNDRVIFLDIENHTPGIFGDEKWIEILHNHFPDAIEQYKTKGITDFHPKLNGIEKQTIWDKGYSMGMTKVNDTIYFSKGIGRMTSGHSAIVALQTNNILRWLKEISTNIENHITHICENFQIDKDNAHFKLRLGNQTFEIIEIISNQLIIKFPESFIIK